MSDPGSPQNPGQPPPPTWSPPPPAGYPPPPGGPGGPGQWGGPAGPGGPPQGPPPSPPQGPPPGPPPGYQQPPPGYQGYQQGPPPGYQQGPPGYQQGAGPGWGAPPKKSGISVGEILKTPTTAVAAALLLAFAVSWFASILTAFHHAADGSYPARVRALELFSTAPLNIGTGSAYSYGNMLWAIALVIVVSILVVREKAAGEDSAKGLGGLLLSVAFIAAAAVAVASVFEAIFDLTLSGGTYFGIDVGIASFLFALAAVPVAGSAALWALHNRPKSPKSAAPVSQYGPPPQ